MLPHSASEQGWLLTMARALGAAARRMRDALLSRQFRTHGFRAGRQPRILGLRAMRIGANVHAADNLWLEAISHDDSHRDDLKLTLGDGVWMSDRVHIACLESIEIGAGTLIGSGCLISDHTHGAYVGDAQSPPDAPPAHRPLHSAGPIVIGQNVWLGDNVTVLSGANIGDGAILGAGSLVKGVIPPATMAVGVPARVIRRWDPALAQWVRAED